MNNSLKPYQLEIFGSQYKLLSDESEHHVIQSAQVVDKYMKEIADRVANKNIQQIAVLAAVRLASMLLYKEAELEQTQLHEKELITLIDRELQEDG